MNKKLLCSTALAGALIVSGSALAELKIGGNFTHTANFASDESSSTATGSNERLGTEMNLILSKSANLSNGLIATYRGVIEFDGVGTAIPDVEYEATIGTKDIYVGLGSDAGNNISSSPTLPAVGFHVGTLSQNTSTVLVINNDGLINGKEANNPSHISLNAKVAGGTASVVYAPNTTENDDDNGLINTSGGGQATSFIYQGSPVPNVNFIIGRNIEVADTDTAATERTNDKIGISYNFGKIRAGYEYQKDELGATEETVDNFAATFAVSDSTTLGIQYSNADTTAAGKTADEEIIALSAGYNLGGASVALSLVDTQNIAGTAGADSQGLVITTKIGF
jgi:hypothetical protein